MFDIFFFSVRSKKKKKKKVQDEDLPVKDLANVTCTGDLYHKGTFTWNRRYVVISDARLLVYRSDHDNKPVLNIALPGCEVAYMEKEKGKNHVLRLSQAASETQWFYTDLKEIATHWIDVRCDKRYMCVY